MDKYYKYLYKQTDHPHAQWGRSLRPTNTLTDQDTDTHTDKQKETDRHTHRDNCFLPHDQNSVGVQLV